MNGTVAERFPAWLRKRLPIASDQRIGRSGSLPACGVHEDDRIVRAEPFAEFPRCARGGSCRNAHPDSLVACDGDRAFEDGVVAACDRAATGFIQRVEHERAPVGIGSFERATDGVGHRPRLCVRIRLERFYDRRTRLRLGGVQRHERIGHTEIAKLPGGLCHADERSPTHERIEHRVGHLPVQLFDEFVQHRLRALVAVGRLERLQRVPVLLTRAKRRFRVVQTTADDVHIAAVNVYHGFRKKRRARRDEGVARDPGPGGVGSHRLAGTPRRCDGHVVHTVLAGRRNGERNPSIRDRSRGVGSLVFDHHATDAELLGQRGALDERRPALAQRHPRVGREREEFLVLVRTERSGFDLVSRKIDRVVVVRRIERLTLGMVAGRRVEPLVGLGTAQPRERRRRLHAWAIPSPD